MRSILALFTVAGLGLLTISSSAAAAPSTPKEKGDPNEKVCESITPIGSRLGSKKVCATRAEWAEKRRQDREAIERGQVGACMPQTTGATGKPGC